VQSIRNLIKPPKLAPGATIAVIAPSGPVHRNLIQSGSTALQSLGYKVVLGKYVYNNTGYLAGKDSERLKDLNQAIEDPAVGAIFCARGGYGAMRLLSGLNYGSFSSNPKPFVGFSDTTALVHALYFNSRVITFHGPMVEKFRHPDDPNLQGLIALLSGESQWAINLDGSRVLRPGRAEGVILGGNLSMIAALVGTPYMPDLEGSILFLEDIGEPVYRIDRMLMSLKLRGSLARLKAIVAGEFHSCGNSDEVDMLLMEITRDLDIPVISGAPFGHGRTNLPFPIGIQAVLDTNRQVLFTLEVPVT